MAEEKWKWVLANVVMPLVVTVLTLAGAWWFWLDGKFEGINEEFRKVRSDNHTVDKKIPDHLDRRLRTVESDIVVIKYALKSLLESSYEDMATVWIGRVEATVSPAEQALLQRDTKLLLTNPGKFKDQHQDRIPDKCKAELNRLIDRKKIIDTQVLQLMKSIPPQ